MPLRILKQYQNIYLLSKQPKNSVGEIKSLFPGRNICVCDFYLENSENAKFLPEGASVCDDVLSIDHHAPIEAFMDFVTSTSFACRYVLAYKHLSADWCIVINHVDTDSLLSATIMSGILPPDDMYVSAAIAADHTGEENVIGDVLQAMEDESDLELSMGILLKLVNKRLEVRKNLARLKDTFQTLGDIVFCEIDRKIDAGLLPSIFPDKKVVAVAWPMIGACLGRWGIKVRLCSSGERISLNSLGLPHTGGRWNAVSTTRDGGTTLRLIDYIKLLVLELNKLKEV